MPATFNVVLAHALSLHSHKELSAGFPVLPACKHDIARRRHTARYFWRLKGEVHAAMVRQRVWLLKQS